MTARSEATVRCLTFGEPANSELLEAHARLSSEHLRRNFNLKVASLGRDRIALSGLCNALR